MPDVPDPDGVTGKNHGGPGWDKEREGYMPLNDAKGCVGPRLEEADERAHSSGGSSSGSDGY